MNGANKFDFKRTVSVLFLIGGNVKKDG